MQPKTLTPLYTRGKFNYHDDDAKCDELSNFIFEKLIHFIKSRYIKNDKVVFSM